MTNGEKNSKIPLYEYACHTTEKTRSGGLFMKQKKKLSLAVQIFIGLGLGIIAGLIFMAAGKAEWAVSYVKPFGTIFLNLIKFIVVPIVLCSIISGVISMQDIKKVGSIGWKTVVYYMCTTAGAVVIGLLFAHIFDIICCI